MSDLFPGPSGDPSYPQQPLLPPATARAPHTSVPILIPSTAAGSASAGRFGCWRC